LWAGIGEEKLKLKPLLVILKDIDSYEEITEQNFTIILNGDGPVFTSFNG